MKNFGFDRQKNIVTDGLNFKLPRIQCNIWYCWTEI